MWFGFAIFAILSILSIVDGRVHTRHHKPSPPSHENGVDLRDLYNVYSSSTKGRNTVAGLFRESSSHDYSSSIEYKSGTAEERTLSDLFFPPLDGQSNIDFHPILRNPPKDDTNVTYYSWHIHVYFFHENDNVTTRALGLRTSFMDQFKAVQCADGCFMGGIFDKCDGICVWDPVYGVDGPHPYGQWGVYLPNELVADTITWLSKNHGEFNVLFHPNTGLMVGDHDENKRALWIKQHVPLDLDFLVWLQCQWFGCDNN